MKRLAPVLAATALVAALPAASVPAAEEPMLVFSSTRTPDLHYEIYIVDPRRPGRRLNLSRHPAADLHPVPSPDGRTIAFVSNRGGAYTLWTVSAAGSGLRRVAGPFRTSSGSSRGLGDVRWHPDGRRLSFVAGSDVYLVPRGGGRPRLLARRAYAHEWSPAGRHLAVVGSGGPAVLDDGGRTRWQARGALSFLGWSARGEFAVAVGAWSRPGNRRISIRAADGTLRTHVGGNTGSWSPDGTLFAVVRTDGIWTLDSGGRLRREVRGRVNEDAPPLWSPDGRSFIYGVGAQARLHRLGGRSIRVNVSQSQAAWSHDGRLATATWSGDVPALAVQRPGSGRRTIVARGAEGICRSWFPTFRWLPDGRLVYSSGHGGRQEADLWTTTPSGSAPRPLVADPREWEAAPAWSPDGTQLVYERGSPNTHAGSCSAPPWPRLWLANADGSNQRLLGDFRPGEIVRNAAWSPDGKSIAFERTWIDAAPNLGIYIADAATLATRRVTIPPHEVFDQTPSWSPDGTRLAFTRNGGTMLHVVNVDGTGLSPLAVGREPAWSPAGDVIAFLRGRALWTIAPDRTGERRLVAAEGSEATVSPPRWSPDGRSLAVALGGRLYVVDESGAARTLASRPGLGEVSWSPDGRRLSFVATAGFPGQRELYMIDAAGGPPTRLTHDLADVGAAAWRP